MKNTLKIVFILFTIVIILVVALILQQVKEKNQVIQEVRVPCKRKAIKKRPKNSQKR